VAVGGAGRASERAGDADGRIKLCLGDTDLSVLRQSGKLRGANVRPAAQQIRRDSNCDRARWHRSLASRSGEQRIQGDGRNTEQQAERVFSLLQLDCQLRNRRLRLLEDVGRLEDITLAAAAALVLKGPALSLKIAAGNVPNFVNLATGGWGEAILGPLNSVQTPTIANFATLADALAGCVAKIANGACDALFAAGLRPLGLL
jgi:hypothetical protein